ncbi:MAG: MBOAT family O-acyltransferase [Rickettsiales bacterium]|nr:MAG: MBOAT family O-acyltransferase [Rickettsiales bacterium]
MPFTTPTFLFILLPFLTIINSFFLIFKLDRIKKYVSINSITLQNALLFIVNLIFYAWSDLRAISIILPLSFVTFVGGLAIEKLSFKRTLLFFFILFDTSVLAFFKYWKIEGIIVPLGISFIYFRLISYMADVYFKKITEQDFYNFLHYVMFFPQVLMGPIARYTEFNNELQNRTIEKKDVNIGYQRFVIGLAKKVLIADTLASVVNKIFALEVIDYGTGIAWIGILFFAFQLYYDFSGFVDMSIGVAKILGFKNVPENFNYPYMSRSVQEFWQRWHITLGAWLRDYVFYPVMMSDWLNKFGDFVKKIISKNAGKKLILYVSLFCLWSVSGVWHGDTWNFVIGTGWLHCFFILSGDLTKGIRKFFAEKVLRITNPNHKFLVITQIMETFFLILIGYVFWRSPTLKYATDFLKNMFGVLPNVVEQYNLWYYLDRMEMLAFAIGVLCAFPLFKKWEETTNIFISLYLVFLLLVSISFVAANTYQSFLYFQF